MCFEYTDVQRVTHDALKPFAFRKCAYQEEVVAEGKLLELCIPVVLFFTTYKTMSV